MFCHDSFGLLLGAFVGVFELVEVEPAAVVVFGTERALMVEAEVALKAEV